MKKYIIIPLLLLFFNNNVKAQSEPMIGQIMWVGFKDIPNGWAACNGELLLIDKHSTLFSLLGTTYGGDGQTTFALPDFNGRTMIFDGQGPGLTKRTLGEMGGEASTTLNIYQIPPHTHKIKVSSNKGTLSDPTDAFPANTGDNDLEYQTSSNNTTMSSTMLSTVGGSPHNNMQPYQTLKCIIAINGVDPIRP